jgi:hypothetical protein
MNEPGLEGKGGVGQLYIFFYISILIAVFDPPS